MRNEEEKPTWTFLQIREDDPQLVTARKFAAEYKPTHVSTIMCVCTCRACLRGHLLGNPDGLPDDRHNMEWCECDCTDCQIAGKGKKGGEK